MHHIHVLKRCGSVAVAAALVACGGSTAPAPSPAVSSAAPSAAASTSVAAKPASSGAAASAAAKPATSVKFGYNPILAGAPVYFTQERGYFAQAGLQVDFTPFDSAAAMTAPLASGQLDAMPAVPSPGLFNALARDVTLRAVAAMSLTNATLQARKDLYDSGQIKTIADMKGKKVSLNVEGSPVDYSVRNILIKNGLNLNDVDVQRVVNSDMAVAFANKALDAGSASEPISTQIVEKGLGVPLANSAQFIGNQTGGFLSFGPSFLNRTDDVPNRFMTAYLRGYRDYLTAVKSGKMTNQDDLAVLSKWTKIAPETIATVAVPMPPADSRLDLEDIKRQQDFWKNVNGVTTGIDVNKLVDYRYLDAALSK